jgi:hypothetical protein
MVLYVGKDNEKRKRMPDWYPLCPLKNIIVA